MAGRHPRFSASSSLPAAKKSRAVSVSPPSASGPTSFSSVDLLPILDSDDSDGEMRLRHKPPSAAAAAERASLAQAQNDIITSLIDNVPLDDDAPVGCRRRQRTRLVKKADLDQQMADAAAAAKGKVEDDDDEDDMNLDYVPVDDDTPVEEDEIAHDIAKIKAAADRLNLREEIVVVTRKEEIGEDGERAPAAAGGNVPPLVAAEDDMEFIQGDQVGNVDTNARRFREISESNSMWRVAGMTTTLMNHQVLGVDWMALRELSATLPIGGLVADEMGLGKTIQSIAVMMLNPPELRGVDYSPVTLIVAPLSLLHQWKEEILQHCKKRALKVFIHHGDTRIRNTRDFRGFDVVLCTYHAIMLSWPRRPKPGKGKRWTQAMTDAWWETAQHTKGVFHRVRFWRVILDECHLIKNSVGATSEACQQLSAVNRWALSGTPIQNSLSDVFPILSFIMHPTAGTKEGFRTLIGTRPNSPEAAQRVQVALRGHMMRRTKMDFLMGLPLISLPRKRIRMVELEFSPEEKELYKAVELHSITLINRYMRKGTEMKNFNLILTMLLRLRQACDHPYLILKTGQTSHIGKPGAALTKERPLDPDSDGDDEKASVNDWMLKSEDSGDEEVVNPKLEHLSLHRVKHEDIADVKHEDGTDVKHEDSADIKFERVHQGERKVSDNDNGASPVKSTSSLLQQALANVKADEEAQGNELCPICSSPIEDRVRTRRCHHEFCRECLTDSLISSPRCPFDGGRCGKVLTEDDVVSAEAGARGEGGPYGDELDGLGGHSDVLLMPSTKTTLLRAQLAEWRANHAGDKIVLFSQFTSMLDIIERVLEREEPDTVFVRYDGSMSFDERQDALNLFRYEPECSLILISIKAGGVGLNLTHANLVVCVDLWWNAAVELQAFDRVHRLGQKKEVFVTRCMIKGTVEERMLELQQQKLHLAKTALGEGRLALGRLTREELLGLFGRVVEKDGRQELAVY